MNKTYTTYIILLITILCLVGVIVYLNKRKSHNAHANSAKNMDNTNLVNQPQPISSSYKNLSSNFVPVPSGTVTTSPHANLPFVTSVDKTLINGPPVPPVWVKVGIVTQNNLDVPIIGSLAGYNIMNLYLNTSLTGIGIGQYTVEDKNGFIIPLQDTNQEIEDGDVINNIVGKPGNWTVKLFSPYVYAPM